MENNAQWLYDDVNQNRNEVTKNDSQLTRRNYLRSVIAFYEVTLSDLREIAAGFIVDEYYFSGKINFHELFPLLDEVSRLTDNGKLKSEPNRIPLLSLVAYTLKTFAKQVNLQKDVLSDNRWEAFCQSIKIRHRITHPKFHSDIEITDEEIKIIDNGLDWWKEIRSELYEKYLIRITTPKTYKQ